MRRKTILFTLGTLLSGLGACSNATGPTITTALLSLAPAGGATNVGSGTSVVVTFSHAMAVGMEQYMSLHEGDVTGPTVACSATWSAGRDTLALIPSAPLKAATHYTLHVGGGMRDANGNVIDMTQHGAMMGGQWASPNMMTGGMMGGGGEMGPGWQGTNGMYGMVFTFTTG